MIKISNRARVVRSGFSLIEVTLSLLVIGIGMLVLFSLFPVSLRQGHDAFRDTQAAMFAEYMLNGIRGDADLFGQDNYAIWSNKLASVQGSSGSIMSAPFPVGSGYEVQYLVELNPVGDRRWGASLWVWGEKYGPKDVTIFKRRSEWFYTELYFEGLTDD
jgi:prepilin-type N-terminal cleavage/methylation domain-containing protein